MVEQENKIETQNKLDILELQKQLDEEKAKKNNTPKHVDEKEDEIKPVTVVENKSTNDYRHRRRNHC